MAETSPWLLVGLGNPGLKYASNRHNVGFMAVERWLDRHQTPGVGGWREKFHGRFDTVGGDFGRCIVLEPLTYMNRSGQAVAAAKTFHRVDIERIIVVHDELDFDFGRVAIKSSGGHGGHNGLRDIIATTGSRDFVRVRVGIGRPERGDVSNWVLTDFSSSDAAELPDVIERANEAIDAIVRRGVKVAMNEINKPQSKG